MKPEFGLLCDDAQLSRLVLQVAADAGSFISIAFVIFLMFAATAILINKVKLSSAVDLAALSAAVKLPDGALACETAAQQLRNLQFVLQECLPTTAQVTISGTTQMSILSIPINLTAQAAAGW